ncbi:MAG: exonuclease SbcCD subunit D [Clostridia bacterium]|nr:exonuclease SbcCD subunit D [Clostridia bacterium]
MVKILHTADMHLDAPFTLEDPSLSEVRRGDLRSAFSAMMMYVKDNSIDLVLIAGDMFDSEFVSKETVSLVVKEFSKLPDCKFVISPGNHDPYTAGGVYKKTEFPDNVFIFSEPSLSYISFDDLNVDVYGYAFTSSTMERNPFTGRKPLNPNRINILLAHGDTSSPISKYCPITENDIAESGFDYIALGHIHTGKEPTKAGETCYAYPGCLEGRDYSEAGHKGALTGSFIKDENGFRYNMKAIRFSRRRYAVERLNVTGSSNNDEIAEAISKVIVKNGYGDDTLLRVTLEGNVTPELKINKKVIERQLRDLYTFDLIDNTLPLYDCEALKYDPTIKGAFFEALLPMLEKGTAEERELAAMALRYGLCAIDGTDIIDFE